MERTKLEENENRFQKKVTIVGKFLSLLLYPINTAMGLCNKLFHDVKKNVGLQTDKLNLQFFL